jgi:drug/metabolite transporter (DMT)-like permease
VFRTDLDRPAIAYTGLVLANLFWAGNAVVARLVVGSIPPFALSFWRWALALLIILPFGLPHILRDLPVIRAHWRPILVLGVLSISGYNTLLYIAAQSTTALNLTLVNATVPVMIALMAWLLLRQRVTAIQSAGIGFALTGIVVIVSQGSWDTLAGLDFRPGDLFMIGAVLVWALYSVLLKRHAVPMHPLGLLTLLILGGLPLLLALYLWELATYGGFELTTSTLLPMGYVAFFAAVLAYLFWNHGVATIGPNRAAIFIYLIPVFASGLAYVFLGEELQGFHAVGGLLVLLGLYLASRFGPAPDGPAGPS